MSAPPSPGQAGYEELVRRVGSEYDSWEKLPGDLRAAHEAMAQAAIDWWHADRELEPPREITVPVPGAIWPLIDDLGAARAERDSITERIAELRVLLSMLADRAEASGAITEDEADEYRKRGGLT